MTGASKVADSRRSIQLALALAAVLLVVTAEWKGCDGCLEDERVALLDVQAFFGGDASCPQPSGGDCCDWCGVTCNDTTGRVMELQFDGSGLKGGRYLNASLFLPFRELSQLSLSSNKLLGCMENEGFEKLSKLVNLKVLNLGENELSNDVFTSLSELWSLTHLYLNVNRLKGRVDVDELNKLSGLRELNLGSNVIEGFTSYHGDEDFLRLAHLEGLDLSYNHFCNDVLSSLSKLSSLEDLDLDGNRLNRTVDVNELNKLSGLKELGLGSNEIEGFTSFHGSETLLRLAQLEELNLSFNNLRSITIFSALKELYSLEYLSLDSNELLQGSVDMKELAALTKLRMLELSGNLTVNDLAALINLERLQLGDESIRILNTEIPFLVGEISIPFPQKTKGRFNFEGSSKLEKLEELVIWNSFIEGNFFEKIGTWMTNLMHLRINNSTFLFNSTVPQGLCNLKHLQEIQLSGNDLVGQLPQCLSKLTLLESVDISDNQLSGDISQSPLATMFSLEDINIAKNQFRIPLSLFPFFNHSRLMEFSGDHNQEIYEGEHHEDMKQQGTSLLHPPLFQLTHLTLGSSQQSDNIDGVFPKFLYHQHELEVVDISNTKLKGAGFPSWLLVNNTNLRDLTLLNCSLSGPFQLSIHQHPLEYLKRLDISKNNLSSPIPPHICAFLPELQQLSLSDNGLFGTISEHLSNCSMLTSLDASNNHLFGRIPRWIWNFPKLQVLDLSRNNFFGSLPSGFFTSRIREVYLSRNLLGGTSKKGDHEISSAHNDYSNYSLSVLDLSHNHIKGTIPRWISMLPTLEYLLLNNNNFYGEVCIPFNLKQFKLIVISHNHLSGRLSSMLISNRSTVQIYDDTISNGLELVTKTHSYTYDETRLALMVGFDFSNNNFVGEIPPQISFKDDIKFLNLSFNKLTGSIPPSFSRLLQIESLDLSHNNLSGFIPSGFTALTYLASFSVAYNNLSGKCPDERVAQFGTFNASSYEGNPFLRCTFPLRPYEPLLTSPTFDNGDDYGGNFIDMESFYASSEVSFVTVLLIIASVLCINSYWRGVWFYYVEITITSCYYFVVGHLPMLAKYKVLELLV